MYQTQLLLKSLFDFSDVRCTMDIFVLYQSQRGVWLDGCLIKSELSSVMAASCFYFFYGSLQHQIAPMKKVAKRLICHLTSVFTSAVLTNVILHSSLKQPLWDAKWHE